MARKPTVIKENVLFSLKEFVQKKVQMNCTSFPEIQHLQFRIKSEIDEYLSIQTLNRFFGLIKSDFKPSAATLDIMARFIGYESYNEFEQIQDASNKQEKESTNSTGFIKAIFSEVDMDHTSDAKPLQAIVRNLYYLIDRQPELANEIYPFMATQEFGRKYFFEQFVYIDALNTHYGDGLNYLLIHSKVAEQRFFAFSLLCLRYFLSCDHHKFNYYFEKINDFKLSEIRKFHPSLVGRYYAIRVYDSFINHKAMDMVEEALATFKKIEQLPDTDYSFPYAEFILGKALVIVQEYYLAWQVLQEGQPFISDMTVNKDLSAQYELLQLHAGFSAGYIEERKASARLQSLHIRPLSNLTKHYYSLMLNNMFDTLLPDHFNKLSEMQSDKSIDKTGFVFFNRNSNKQLKNELLLMEINGKKVV